MNILKPHVSLNVSNVEASVAFYEKLFGVTVTKRRPGYAKFDLAAPSLNLTMQEAEDVGAAWTRFKAASLPTLTENDTSCCYALQDKVWVTDPDGNSWEVFVVKGDADTMQTAKDPAKKGCCAPRVSADSSDA